MYKEPIEKRGQVLQLHLQAAVTGRIRWSFVPIITAAATVLARVEIVTDEKIDGERTLMGCAGAVNANHSLECEETEERRT
jgi:hypothetical protein